jgi:hypothetical protein
MRFDRDLGSPSPNPIKKKFSPVYAAPTQIRVIHAARGAWRILAGASEWAALSGKAPGRTIVRAVGAGARQRNAVCKNFMDICVGVLPGSAQTSPYGRRAEWQERLRSLRTRNCRGHSGRGHCPNTLPSRIEQLTDPTCTDDTSEYDVGVSKVDFAELLLFGPCKNNRFAAKLLRRRARICDCGQQSQHDDDREAFVDQDRPPQSMRP